MPEQTAHIAPSPSNPVHTPIDGASYIPLALLAPSPTNPRKRFDRAHLEELAGSLKKHGQIAPIVARPHTAGTREQLAAKGLPLYEIVAGERRWRAAALAELPSVMTIVRDMTDFEVIEVQVIENLQREDLDPIDEAAGYAALLQTGDRLQGYATVDQLAARIGKSRRYVFNRLKLLELCDKGREALATGTLSVSVAQIVAGLPTQKQQEEAIERVVIGFGGEPMTYKTALEYLTKTYMLRLEKARFDIRVAYDAAGPCTSCSKRTGAHADLFADVQGGDMCQDADCFDSKTEEAHQAELAAARKAGYTVLEKAEALAILPNPRGGAPVDHRRLDEPCPALTESKHTLRALLGPKFKPVIALDHPTTETVIYVAPEMAVRRALAAKDLLRAGLATSDADKAGGGVQRQVQDDEVGPAPSGPGATPHAPAAATAAPRRMTAQQREEAAQKRRGALFGPLLYRAIHQALQARDELPIEALEMMVMSRADDVSFEALALVFVTWGWPRAAHSHSMLDEMREHVAKLDGRQMGELLIELVLLAEDLSDGRPLEEMHYSQAPELAEALGIDVKAIDSHAADQANAEIDAEQAAAEQAAAQAKRDKMLPPAAGPVTELKRTVKYRDPATGSTWSGRGLQPAWVKSALAEGRNLSEFEAAAQADAATEAFAGAGAA